MIDYIGFGNGNFSDVFFDNNFCFLICFGVIVQGWGNGVGNGFCCIE